MICRTFLPWLAVLLFVDASIALAQGSPEHRVLQTDRAWADAGNTHHSAALDQILDDRCATTSTSGKMESKKEFLKGFTGDANPTMTQDELDRDVHIYGRTAIPTETDNDTYTESGRTSTDSLRLTTTYLRRGDRWVAIAE